MRRKLRRVAKNKIIFIDETNIKEDVIPQTTLVLSGDSGEVPVRQPESYAPRLDIIGSITSEVALPMTIFTPQQRKSLGTKGVTAAMFNSYIQENLGPALNGMDIDDMILVLDNARIHNVNSVERALDNAGVDNVKEILLLPKQSAKKVSPLDNALWNAFKQRVQEGLKNKRATLNQVQSKARAVWESLEPELLESEYRQCRLFKRQPLADDLN